jgi:hypothetical protein
LGFVFCTLAACSPPLDAEALRAHAAQATPTWDNYDEDLKAQLGATPVALWMGHPLSFIVHPTGIEVLFAVSGPWKELQAQVPVLLRTPEGVVCPPVQAETQTAGHRYFFVLPEEFEAAPPWIELRFPRGERRLYGQEPSLEPEAAL